MPRSSWTAVVVCALAWSLSSPARAVSKVWTSAISSSWSEAVRWTPNGVPAATDSATFNKPGEYTVYFSNVFQDLNSMAVSAGTVTFERLVSPATLSVTNGSGDRNLAVTNATLNLGSSLPVNMTVGNTTLVNAGGTLNLRAGSNLTTQDLTVNAGGAFNVNPGSSFTQTRNVLVDGGSFTRPAGANWTHPAFGGVGSFTAKNNAQVNFGDTVTPNDSNLTITSGADVTATGAINLGEGPSTMLIDGVGSTLTAGGTSFWSGIVVAAAIRNGATVNLGNFNFFGASGIPDPNPNAILAIESAPSLTTSLTAGNIALQGPYYESTSADRTVVTVGNGLGQSIVMQTGATSLVVGFNASYGGATLQINDAGSFVGGTGGVTINSNGVITIAGGSFSTGGAITNNDGAFNFTSGSLSYVGNLAVAGGGLLGANVVLNADRKLTLTGTTTVDATRSLTLNGGTLNTGALVVNGTFVFNSGKLGITGASGLTIGSSGPLGANFNLGAARTLSVTQTTTVAAGATFTINAGGAFTSSVLNNQGELALGDATAVATATTLTNSGLLRGTGKVTAAVTNAAAGIVRASAGERLRFAGASFANQGLIEAIGTTASPAEVEFSSSVTNSASTGLIAGRNNVLRFNGGLANQGSVAVSFGTSDVFGDISNAATGAIIISGGADVTFYDDILQNGLFRVSKIGSTTSAAVVLGSFSGSGGSTGGGDIFFEGDLRPGNSAATVTFDNNVAFGPGTELQIELAGPIAGAQYDQVHVTGDLSLAGTLAVALVGYTPTPGQTFDILDWGTRTGTFAALQLPTLAGLQWDTSRLYVDGVLSVVQNQGFAADFDEDTDVDGHDLTMWRTGFGTTAGATHMQGDADADGDVDGNDFLVWQRQLGSGVTPAAAVPEPATIPLILAASLALAIRRRGRDPS